MSESSESPAPLGVTPTRRDDFITLTKAKLSLLVVVTTGAGFVSAWPWGDGFDGWRFFHTLLGTTAAAFGASVFNQLLEVDADRRMKRTEDRPVAAGRIPTVGAFGLGWMLSAFGIVHLGVMVNVPAALLAGLTLAIYIFAYTPLKRRSSLNTLVGAVSGAIPPVIGWVGAGGAFDPGALWWFSLLFFWQLPHFFAINWIHREEYRKAGFVMLANEDHDGSKTAKWSFALSLPLILLAMAGPLMGVTRVWSILPGVIVGVLLSLAAWRFLRERTVGVARKLFFATLLYLPVIMLLALLADQP